MTVGQLLHHISDACGSAMRGFVTGDWGMPEGVSYEDIPPEEMLPKADKMPTVASVAEARRLLAADKELAVRMLAEAGEERLQALFDHRVIVGQHLGAVEPGVGTVLGIFQKAR